MAQTFDLITSQTLTSDTNVVSFGSFSGYTDLVIVGQWVPATGGSVANDLYMYFNSNTSSIYQHQQMVADNTNLVTNGTSGGVNYGIRVLNNSDSAASTKMSGFEMNIYEYASTNFPKCVYTRWTGAAANPSTGMFYGFWDSTTAVTSIQLQTNTATNIKAGSLFSLYGILIA
jgi:hypothetical protein